MPSFPGPRTQPEDVPMPEPRRRQVSAGIDEGTFVTGGTGYVGVPLIRALVARGHPVRALARAGSENKLPAGCDVVIGDALQMNSYADAVAGCSTCVHLVGVAHPSPSKAE